MRTSSRAGMPIFSRYCRSASVGWMPPAHVSESVSTTKQSTCAPEVEK